MSGILFSLAYFHAQHRWPAMLLALVGQENRRCHADGRIVLLDAGVDWTRGVANSGLEPCDRKTEDRTNFTSASYEKEELHPDHLLLDSALNLGPLVSRCEINKFENCWYKSVRILEVLKLLFQQILNFSTSQQEWSNIRGTVQL